MIRFRHYNLQYRGADTPALKDVCLEIPRGEMLLLTGQTGCGKTTLLRAIAGFIGTNGEASISGELTVDGFSTSAINRQREAPRVGIVFQNPDDQITAGTPREEVEFGLENTGCPPDEIRHRVDMALEQARLLDRKDDDINSLSGGQKQRVVAAAVIATEPDILLLDEPASNLDAKSKSQLLEYLAGVKARGTTVIVCSHDTGGFLDMCDRFAAMEKGAITHTGPPEDSVDTVPWRSFMPDNKATEPVPAMGHELLRLADMEFGYKGSDFRLGPLSLTIHSGERIALIGPNGGGKSTLISLLAGLRFANRGQVYYRNKPLNRKGLSRRYRALAYVAQNPDLMLHCSSVRKELLSRPDYLGIDSKSARLAVDNSLQYFRLEEFGGKHPFSLSQGQRQRLALGAAVTGGADLLLVDEPTTGQDREHTMRLMRRLVGLSELGMAVVFSSHNLEAVFSAVSRVIVLADGKVKFDGSPAQFAGEAETVALAGFDVERARTLFTAINNSAMGR